MPATTIETQIVDGLTGLLRRGASRSSALGRPVLASLTLHLGPAPDHDLAALIEQPDSFVWEQPSRGFVLAGAGHELRITASGPGRFREVRDRLQAVLADAVIRQDSGAALRATPLSFAGFAFDPDRADNVAWFGFPDAQAVIPRLLFARSGAHLFLTLNAMVDPETDPDFVARDLARVAARLAADAAQPVPGALPARFLDPGADAHDLWDESVRALTRGIADGDTEKVVLARRVQVETAGAFDVRAVLGRLRGRFPDCTLFAVRGGEACFAGATPEMLVSLQGRRIRTDCLAGSARRGRDADEDERIARALLDDDKERREHALVARGLREALGTVSSEVRLPDLPALRRMANVQHLHTPIEAVTDGDRHVLDLVELLHPTAATAGLPRERALGLIREHEPFSRGWYAGPIGWIDAEGGGEFAVALRSALLRDDVASLYAGCGIVRGSDPAREYAESEIKLAAMLWALNASNGER